MRVDRPQRQGHLRHQLGGRVRRQRPLLQHLVERRGGDVFRDDEVGAVPVAQVEDAGDVGVFHPGRDPHFPHERLQDGRVGRAVGRQHLQAQVPPGVQVLGQEDHADAVLPDAVQNLVVVEDEPAGLALQQVHGLELRQQLLADEQGGQVDRVVEQRGVDRVLSDERNEVVGRQQPALANRVEEGRPREPQPGGRRHEENLRPSVGEATGGRARSTLKCDPAGWKENTHGRRRIARRGGEISDAAGKNCVAGEATSVSFVGRVESSRPDTDPIGSRCRASKTRPDLPATVTHQPQRTSRSPRPSRPCRPPASSPAAAGAVPSASRPSAGGNRPAGRTGRSRPR